MKSDYQKHRHNQSLNIAKHERKWVIMKRHEMRQLKHAAHKEDRQNAKKQITKTLDDET